MGIDSLQASTEQRRFLDFNTQEPKILVHSIYLAGVGFIVISGHSRNYYFIFKILFCCT